MEKLIYTIFIPVVFVLLWSSGYIFVESGLTDCTPILFLTLRFFIAAMIIGVVIFIRKIKFTLSAKEIIQISITGVLLQSVYLGFFLLR